MSKDKEPIQFCLILAWIMFMVFVISMLGAIWLYPLRDKLLATSIFSMIIYLLCYGGVKG